MAETNVRIGVILASVRESRRGEAFARWIHGLVAERPEVEAELLDLREWTLPPYAHKDSPVLAEKTRGASSAAGRTRSLRSTASWSSPPSTTTATRGS